MKITILFLFFTTPLLPAFALGECPEGQEACSASAKKTSDFLKTVEAAQKTHAPAATAQKSVPANPAGVTDSVTAPSVTVAAQKSTEAQGGTSQPAWLLLVGGGLAALYYYLKEEKRRGRKK
ncbi:MAG: hypothetical protein A2X34_02450 [Elusimicrobia bacterium GWC2_51_8]|nr:MAG: hypothetical protein A2X33_11155 [Elusimicrobia bacterium GWA2_51_34]OGR60572.1 MAG: hypothetical protein A2X34_02450 [Elusimicrobia bacterium GWC2_51_8]HAF94774.1 hypothetical protein [Elusimicrobiota bacterium]HCE99020.1 hypothetical protein [Elusimicrobiota bacterium]